MKHTPLTTLDVALADFLDSRMPSSDPRHRWLAALTSHQWGRGHACLDLDKLRHDPGALLAWDAASIARWPDHLTEAAQSLPWRHGQAAPLVLHGQRLYLQRAWHAEQSIRQHLQRRHQLPPSAPAELSSWLDQLFKPATGDPARDGQRLACALAMERRTLVIAGGPGTGKTTTVTRLLALLQRASPTRLHILLAAPTGKAAARLNASIAQARRDLPSHWTWQDPVPAQTLHRLLKSSFQAGKSEAGPRDTLSADVLVLDEASMVDLEMMARLLQALPDHARLILLGDRDQLASVEAGAVLAQLCEGPLMREHTATLTWSHRFAAGGDIARWADAVNQGDAHELRALWTAAPVGLNHPDTQVTRLDLPAPSTSKRQPGLASVLRQVWTPWWQQVRSVLQQPQGCDEAQARSLLDGFAHWGVLCALREGPWGVRALNQFSCEALGLPLDEWAAGRPVMVTRNDDSLGVMNGDIGLCLPRQDGQQPPSLWVAFPDGTGVRWIAPARLDTVETVFAMTVHKSQGSEFAQVLLVLPSQDTPVLTRELIYTGLTRARERLVLCAANEGLLRQACQRRVERSGGLADEV